MTSLSASTRRTRMARGFSSGRKTPLPPKPPILEVFEHYYEHIEIPDYGAWRKILCPLHPEDRPSASVSPEVNYWQCHAWDISEDSWDIVMREQGIGFREAVEWADARFGGGSEVLPRAVPGEPSRGIPDRPRFGRRGEQVYPRVRRRFGDGA